MSMGPEKKIENGIKRYLDSIGAYHIKNHGSMYSKAGTPDIVACVQGRFVAIEVKRESGGKVSELQKAHIKIIEQAGGLSMVACSVNDVKTTLQEMGLVE